jgi:hypothetical protein
VTRWVEYSDVPRSPVTRFPTKRPYCTIVGSFRPSFSRIPAICSAVALSPASVTAGSPWDHLRQPEHDQRDEEQHRDRQCDPAQDQLAHVLRSLRLQVASTTS